MSLSLQNVLVKAPRGTHLTCVVQRLWEPT